MVSRGGSPSRLLGKVRSPGWEERTCVVSLVQLVTCVSDLLAPGSSPSLTPKASTESGVGVKEEVLNPDALYAATVSGSISPTQRNRQEAG